jgi:hypothetical protein
MTMNYRQALYNDRKMNEALADEASRLGQEVPASSKQAPPIKRSLPVYMIAARVTDARRTENVREVTGYTMCDFDHIPIDKLELVRRRINADPHTLLCYVTVSGVGLRVIAAYERPEEQTLSEAKEAYPRWFRCVNEYYQRLTGIEYDKKCKDLVRLSIASHDPLAYYNPQAAVFSLHELEAATQKEKSGRTLRQKSTSRLRQRTVKDVEVIFKKRIQPLLKTDGLTFTAGAHNEYVMRTGYLLNKYGVEESDAVMWAEQKFGEEYPAASSVVVSCYKKVEEHGDWADRITPDLQGGQMKRASAAEITEFLKSRVEARRNVIRHVVEIRWIHLDEEDKDEADHLATEFHNLSDEDLNTLSGYIEQDMGRRATPDDIRLRLNSKGTRIYNPMLEYVNSLPAWHPGDKDYIAELAGTLHLTDDSPQERSLLVRCLKKWLVGAVRGWTNSNMVNELFFILQGGQGCFKTTWLRMLMPPVLQEYIRLRVCNNNLSKDDVLSLAQFVLIIHDEMEFIGPQQISETKASSSATFSNERAPYERNPVRREHIASHCGTTNLERFLSDPTGSRRFMPFAVDYIDSPYEHPFHYEGIYSQAYALAKDPSFRHYLNTEEQRELEDHNRQFESIRCEEEIIRLLYRVPTQEEIFRGEAKWLVPSQVKIDMQNYSHSFNIDVNGLGRIMKKLGFPKEAHGHNHQIGYLMIPRRFEEIERESKQAAVDILKNKLEKSGTSKHTEGCA